MSSSNTSRSVNTSQLIYYFIIIITALISLYYLLKSQDFNGWWSASQNKAELNVDQQEMYRDDEDDDVQEPSMSIRRENRNYNLKKVPIALDIDTSMVTQSSSLQFGFDDFCNLVSNDDFIKSYYITVMDSIRRKKRFYRTKLDEADALYNQARSKSGGSSFVVQHDTTRDRLGALKKELQGIYEAVCKRELTVTINGIRKDMFDIINDNGKGLASLVGRDDMKHFLCRQIYAFANNHRAFANNFQNMIIYGSSGVGKTKLAEVISWVYSKSNILIRRKYRVVTKADMASPFVSESGPMTRNLLYESIEAVLFFDEAYSITQQPTMLGRGLDHGNDVVEEMVKFLDSWCGYSVFIAAGYKAEMEERFLKSNQGMDRRFPYKITLSDYDTMQLTSILLGFLQEENRNIEISENCADFLYSLVDTVKETRRNAFKLQAGDCKNLSGFISTCISTANEQYRWGQSDKINNLLLLSGMNNWLRTKDLQPVS